LHGFIEVFHAGGLRLALRLAGTRGGSRLDFRFLLGQLGFLFLEKILARAQLLLGIARRGLDLVALGAEGIFLVLQGAHLLDRLSRGLLVRPVLDVIVTESAREKRRDQAPEDDGALRFPDTRSFHQISHARNLTGWPGIGKGFGGRAKAFVSRWF
jgi:hypothetical protein